MRRQNVRSSPALAKWRSCRAVELLADGKTYEEIARGVGYANRGTAHRVVAKALAENLHQNIELLRTLEGERLDRLQTAFWDRAISGDRQAAHAVLKIIEQRCRLYSLYDSKPVWSSMRLVMSREEAAAYELGRQHALAEHSSRHETGNTGEATPATVSYSTG